MKEKTIWSRFFMLVMGLAFVTAGCAAIQKSEAKSTEQLLSAAGFHMKLANTPEQLANIQAMKQRTILTHQKDGQPRYVYTDALACKCVYVGNEAAYQEFQKLQVQQNIADENLMTAQMNQDVALDWDVWGPWVD